MSSQKIWDSEAEQAEDASSIILPQLAFPSIERILRFTVK